jgi:hypothetical protein
MSELTIRPNNGLVVIGANHLASLGIDRMDAATGDTLDSLDAIIVVWRIPQSNRKRAMAGPARR